MEQPRDSAAQREVERRGEESLSSCCCCCCGNGGASNAVDSNGSFEAPAPSFAVETGFKSNDPTLLEVLSSSSNLRSHLNQTSIEGAPGSPVKLAEVAHTVLDRIQHVGSGATQRANRGTAARARGLSGPWTHDEARREHDRANQCDHTRDGATGAGFWNDFD